MPQPTLTTAKSEQTLLLRLMRAWAGTMPQRWHLHYCRTCGLLLVDVCPWDEEGGPKCLACGSDMEVFHGAL